MAPNTREQIGSLPESLDFHTIYSELKTGVLSDDLLPTSVQTQLLLKSYNVRVLEHLGETVFNQDLSQPTELFGGKNGNQWWINTTEPNEYGQTTTTISYRENRTDWMTATFSTEQIADQKYLKSLQLKLQGGEELLLADLNADPSGEVFTGVAAAQISGESTTAVTKLIKFLVENIEDDVYIPAELAPLPQAETAIALRGALEHDQEEIMEDLKEACGVEEAYRIMTFLFFNGATNEQWVDTMHLLMGTQHAIDFRSEARVAIQNNPIGRFLLGGIRTGISLAERLKEALGSDFDILQLTKDGDKYLYQLTYPNGWRETIDEETLVSRAKYAVMRCAIDNARFKNNMPLLEN